MLRKVEALEEGATNTKSAIGNSPTFELFAYNGT